MIIDTRKDIQYGTKAPGVIQYNNIGFASSILKYENSWMEYFDPNWKKNQTFLKLTTIDFDQKKAFGTDGSNNFANNTDPSRGGKPYPDLLMYWNIYRTTERLQTTWKFYTYVDNLSFLGGLLDIFLFVPSFLMIVYTFRINEINVFFYQ